MSARISVWVRKTEKNHYYNIYFRTVIVALPTVSLFHLMQKIRYCVHESQRNPTRLRVCRGLFDRLLIVTSAFTIYGILFYVLCVHPLYSNTDTGSCHGWWCFLPSPLVGGTYHSKYLCVSGIAKGTYHPREILCITMLSNCMEDEAPLESTNQVLIYN